jgi:hypothetical protein
MSTSGSHDWKPVPDNSVFFPAFDAEPVAPDDESEQHRLRLQVERLQRVVDDMKQVLAGAMSKDGFMFGLTVTSNSEGKSGMEPLKTVAIANAAEVDELVMFVRRLVRQPGCNVKLKTQAMDYLRRKGLVGSPLAIARDREGKSNG